MDQDLSILFGKYVKVQQGIERTSFANFLNTEKDPINYLYGNYVNVKNMNNIKDESFGNFISYNYEFNVRRFWFEQTKNKKKISEKWIYAFQDGVGTIFEKGEYLNGGKLEGKETKKDAEFDIFESDDQYEDEDFKKFVHVYHPSKLYKTRKNYYLYLNGEYLIRNRGKALIRYYFNINPEAKKENINKFISFLRDWLNSRNIPFKLKLPYNLKNFNRSDNCVLYLSQNHFFLTKDLIFEIQKQFGLQGLNIFYDSIPLFVKKIFEGVGFAEDPNFENSSFGSHRCKLIYNIVNDYFKHKKGSNYLSWVNLKAELKNQNYNLEEFYRNPGTHFDYDFNENPAIPDIDFIDEKHLNESYEKYFKISLEYSLDLIEKAVWIDKDSVLWLTYAKEGKKEYYKTLSESESSHIFYFLGLVIRIKEYHALFPIHLISIIQEKNKEILKNPGKIEELKKKYLDVEDNISKLEPTEMQLIISKWSRIKNVHPPTLNQFDKIINMLKGWLSEHDKIEETKIYSTIINYSNKKIVKEVAEEIYNDYEKIKYPIKNIYGNYEYCPDSKGKLHIAKMFLFLYCPFLF